MAASGGVNSVCCTLMICPNETLCLFVGVWSLRVASTKWDNVLVLAFVGQTRYVIMCAGK